MKHKLHFGSATPAREALQTKTLIADMLPDLSGLIREHAALLVNNPTLPLSAMPFAPV